MILLISLIAIFSTFMVKYYMEIFLHFTNRRKWMWFIYFIWQVYISVNTNLPVYANLIINIALIYLLSCFLFTDNFTVKLVFVILYNGMWLLLELIMDSIFILMSKDIIEYQIYGSILSKLILFLFIWIISKVFDNRIVKELPYLYSVILSFIPLGSMFIIYNTFNICVKQKNIWEQIYLIISLIITMIINICVFKLYLKMSDDLEVQRLNIVYVQKIECYKQYIKEKTADIEYLREEKHNIKQKYILMKSLLSNKEYDKLEKMLNQYVNDSLLLKKRAIQTENIIIDSIINCKYELAIQNNIEFDIRVNIPAVIKIDSGDMCVLLGNILDNALEATLKIPEGRYIFCRIKYSNGVLLIRIQNSYNGYIKRNKNGKLITIKEDYKNHGIGLNTVSKIIKKYNGLIEYDITDKLFTVDIFLYEK